MKSSDLFNILHNAVEAQYYGKKISLKEMSSRLDIPMRTYQDWKLGNSKPQAAVAIFKMLGELDEEDALRVIKKISKGLKHDQDKQSWTSGTRGSILFYDREKVFIKGADFANYQEVCILNLTTKKSIFPSTKHKKSFFPDLTNIIKQVKKPKISGN